ncbi:NUDIX domain-containing protein, partial [Frigidibacter oleivorans]|uniref:NUDIX domain-containing protein n=1 Tax=Frigidibacter oleivorans TaxID=2487129 RepID=UPI000F8E1026
VAGRGAGPAQPWRAGDWAPRWAATVAGAAADAMALLAGAGAVQDPAAVMARWPQMLVRAGARLRAEAGKPATLRRTAAPGDIEVRAARQPYARFFSVEEHDLAWRRFDGTMTPVVPRATFVSADAVIVLPYDPVRDRVLVIEQFRMGPFVRGDRQPWMLEPVAGRVDGGETPEEAAMRETQEEAGLVPRALVPGPSCYASPGAKTEYLYAFAAICDLPDGSAGLGGVEGETEDIRGHLMPFDRLMTLIDTGEVDLAPLIVLALWLDRRRAELRAAARGEADRLQAAG